MNENDNEEPDDIEFSGTLNRLTSIVQEQYRKTLSKAIQENYSNWSILEYGAAKLPSVSYTEKWTGMLVEKALKSCMIAQFYRADMLKFVSMFQLQCEYLLLDTFLPQMNEIKDATKKGELISSRCSMNCYETQLSSSSSQVTSTTMDNSTQTDQDQESPLSEKDISVLKEIRRSHKKPKTTDPVLDMFDEPVISEENLEFHLSAMFNDQPAAPDLNSNSIPESQDKSVDQFVDYDPELKQLLLAIDENNRLLKTRSEEQQELPSKRHTSNENTRKELMKSVWPCKLYHYRRQLQESLLMFSEQHSRNTDLIKQRFLDLFGEDSDDEFGAFSPLDDMDSEMLLSSSKKRVATMVVQHLMEYFKKGLVGEKATFKSLAQDFTECIIANDMYPSFMVVKGVIDGYFYDDESETTL